MDFAELRGAGRGRAGRGSSPFPGTDNGSFPFPFPVPHGAAGEPPKKPCRACTDFKSWLREQRKQAAPGSAVRRGRSLPWELLATPSPCTAPSVLHPAPSSGMRLRVPFRV
uniref:Uncharacterized protein n=1 Tax=Cyanistes caeruleus TaxID=156563 RepID=A0A8C0VMM7_CYACU